MPTPCDREPPTRRRRITRSCTLAVGAISAVGSLWQPAAAGQVAAGVSIPEYAATVTVNQDGSLHVGEAVTYDFTSQSTDKIRRVILTREQYDADNDRVYDLTDVTVDAVQSDVSATVTSDEGADTIDVDFAAPQTDKVTVTFDYDVQGAVAETADGLEVRWPVVQGFDAPIGAATVTWDAPGVNWLSCLAGSPGTSQPCTTAQMAEVASPVMTQSGLAAGDRVVGILGLSSASGVAANAEFDARWSVARAFTAEGMPLWVALAVLALGLLTAFGLWWTRGRDIGDPRKDHGLDAVRPMLDGDDGQLAFHPPGGIMPGQMGTLVDERADVIDVTSTVVDLAVRGYLFIEELPRGGYDRNDWVLRRREGPGGDLLAYEREILDGLFSAGDDVRVSELDGTLRDRLGVVQGLMYDDLVVQGWFGERPDAVRSRWMTAGWSLVAAGAVLTVALALASTFGLLGLAVMLSGVALALAGQEAPARTSQGSRMLGELRRFRAYLESADAGELPAAQREVLVSRCYPYALVFGVGDRWADALAATDRDTDPDQPLRWYGAPTDWHLSAIAPSLARLTITLNAVLLSRRLLDEEGAAGE